MTGISVPQRITNVIDRPNFQALVLTATHRGAVEQMHEDARLIADIVGKEEVALGAMKVVNALAQIRLANGSRILYIGGRSERLEQRVRGLRVDQVDGGGRLEGFVVRRILR